VIHEGLVGDDDGRGIRLLGGKALQGGVLVGDGFVEQPGEVVVELRRSRWELGAGLEVPGLPQGGEARDALQGREPQASFLGRLAGFSS
jgi:hypothetical protein